MAGFGTGIAFSGEVDNTYLEMLQQARKQQAAERQAQQEAQRKAMQEQQARFGQLDDKFNQSVEKVHPRYREGINNLHQQMVDLYLKGKQENPYGFASDPNFINGMNNIRGKAQDYVAMSPLLYDIENPKDGQTYIPGKETVPDQIKNASWEDWVKYTGNHDGLLQGDFLYKDGDIFNNGLNDIKKNIEYNPDGSVQFKDLGNGFVKTNEKSYRDKEAAKASWGSTFDANQDLIKYKYPEYVGKRDEFIKDMIAKTPLMRNNPAIMNKPKADNNEYGGEGGGGSEFAPEDIVNKVEYLVNDPTAFTEEKVGEEPDKEALQHYFLTGEGASQTIKPVNALINRDLAGTPLDTYRTKFVKDGKLMNGQVQTENVVAVEKNKDGTFTIHTDKPVYDEDPNSQNFGNQIEESSFTISKDQFYSRFINTYLDSPGNRKGTKYKSAVIREVKKRKILGDDGKEYWDKNQPTQKTTTTTTPSSTNKWGKYKRN